MGHRQADAFVAVVCLPCRFQFLEAGDELDAVFSADFHRVGPWVVDIDPAAVLGELPHDIDDPAVADVRAVLFEGDAQHQGAGPGNAEAPADHQFYQPAGHIAAHVVVYTASRKNDLRMVADGLGLVGQIVRVYAYAVSAYQTGPEGKEVPLGSRRLQHLPGVYPQASEDEGQLIDEGNVDVPLGVLYDLCRFGHADGRGLVGAGSDDSCIETVHTLGDFRGRAAGDLHYLGHRVLLVPGVDALGAVAAVEVFIVFQSAVLLEDRHALLLGGAGVDGALVDHDVALFERPADDGAGGQQGPEVRLLEAVDRGGHRDDKDNCLPQVLRFGGERKRSAGCDVLQVGGGRLLRVVFSRLQLSHPLGADVETDDLLVMLGEFHGQGQAYVAEADYCYAVVHCCSSNTAVKFFHTGSCARIFSLISSNCSFL